MAYRSSKTLKAAAAARRRRQSRRRSALLLIASVLLATLVVGGTVAYLIAISDPVTNTFTPAHVTCEVTEDFNGTVKKNVNVTNTSNIPAYLRVKLITYRVNEAGEHIGGTAAIPEFAPGEGWFKYGDYYYYTKPVEPDKTPENPLIDATNGITLLTYTDADGGKQVIEVIAEAIQSVPPAAVGEAWGVTIAENSVTPYNGGGVEQ